MKRRILTVILAGQSGLAAAQTNDHIYRSWSWSPVSGAARAAGLSGAFEAIADDASTVASNPAGMLLLPKSEIAAALYRPPSATAGVADHRDSVSGIGFLGGSGRIGPRIAIGGYLAQPRTEMLRLGTIELPDHATYSGAVESRIAEGGAAIAYSPLARVSLGVRFTATHLELEGAYRRTGSSELPDLESGSAAGHTRFTGSFGMLYGTLDDALRVSLSVRAGASYSVDRTANQLPGGS